MLEKVLKTIVKFQGPRFGIGEKVFVSSSRLLKIPREVLAIGWNESGGHFFYALSGAGDELFKESEVLSWDLIMPRYIRRQQARFEAKKLRMVK